jgi:hypothetical protein
MRGLEGTDLAFVFQGQTDVVQSVEQAVASERLYLEGRFESVSVANRAVFQIDGQRVLGIGRVPLKQTFDLFFVQLNREDPVLEAVVVKDIRKGRSDDASDAVIIDGPNRVLSRRTATEIASRDQDGGGVVSREIQFKVGVRGSIFVESPIKKEELAEAASLDAFEKLLGNDLIGVDVRAIHGGDHTGVFGKRIHGKGLV